MRYLHDTVSYNYVTVFKGKIYDSMEKNLEYIFAQVVIMINAKTILHDMEDRSMVLLEYELCCLPKLMHMNS